MEAHLVKVIKSSVQIGEHARRRFVGDLDSVFQDALRKHTRSKDSQLKELQVDYGGSCGLKRYEHHHNLLQRSCKCVHLF